MLKVLHVITGLNQGGAETALLRLLEHEDKASFSSQVFSLIGDGPVAERIRRLGVNTFNCESQRRPLPAVLLTLVLHCRRTQPDIVQGWMYHGNLAATLAARASNVRWHGWNVRCSPSPLLEKKWGTRSAVKLGAKLSPLADWIVYNSERGEAAHRQRGFISERALVIPNGFDCEALAPDARLRSALRANTGITEDHLVVGTLARWHPQKDYPSFIRCAAEVASHFPQARFVGIGHDVDWNNTDLRSQIDGLGLRDRFRLLGEVPDAGRYAAMFDVNVLASAFGEGFPNAIAEGMACGVPCVGTDVGDTAPIIATTGRVVSPSDSRALAAAICELLDLSVEERARLGAAARARIVNDFSMKRNVAAYAKLFRRVEVEGNKPLPFPLEQPVPLLERGRHVWNRWIR
jgi:glycosyltransferase involved in cell wall biosynthesis